MDTLNDVLSRIDAQQATQPTPDALETIKSLVSQGMTSGLGLSDTGAPQFTQPAYNVPAGYAGPIDKASLISDNAAADIPVYNGTQLSPQTIEAQTMAGGPLRGILPPAQARAIGTGVNAWGRSGVAPAVQGDIVKGMLEKLGLTPNEYQKAYETAQGKAAGELAGLTGGGGAPGAGGGGGAVKGGTTLKDAPFGSLPIDDVAEKVANGDMLMPSGFALKTPYWQAVLQRAIVADPKFSQGINKARYNINQEIAKGTGFGGNIVSINQAINHLGELHDAIGQLNNSSFTPYNFATNQAANLTGGTAVTNYNTKADAVASELGKVFKGTGSPTNIEVQGWRNNLSVNKSPEQQQAAIDAAITLMRGRVNAIQDRYKATTGRMPPGGTFLSPEAQSIVQSFGYDPMTLKKLSVPGAPASAPAAAAPAAPGRAQAPQSAIDFLKANPGQAANFKAKYGYLP